jgi:alpha-glucosidase
VRQWTGQKPIEELTLYVYFKQGREESTLYEDAGEGYEYQDGDYCLQQFSTLGEGKNFRLERKETGKFQVTYKTVKLYLVGFPAFVGACRVNGQEVPIKEIRLRDRSLYTLNVPSDFEVVVWEGK